MDLPDEAKRLIDVLGLEPLPEEGGFYREVYRARPKVTDHNPEASGSGATTRSLATHIYYLLAGDQVSLMHRVMSDELFHHYDGDPVEQLQLSQNGEGRVVRLGANFDADEQPYSLVPGGVWQGARLADGGCWALMGCSVVPGFEWGDFQLANRATLTEAFPEWGPLIETLTPPPGSA